MLLKFESSTEKCHQHFKVRQKMSSNIQSSISYIFCSIIFSMVRNMFRTIEKGSQTSPKVFPCHSETLSKISKKCHQKDKFLKTGTSPLMVSRYVWFSISFNVHEDRYFYQVLTRTLYFPVNSRRHRTSKNMPLIIDSRWASGRSLVSGPVFL